jgi:hypothetical protein
METPSEVREAVEAVIAEYERCWNYVEAPLSNIVQARRASEAQVDPGF